MVEVYAPNLKFECDDIIVALTPWASYSLDKAGIKYSILEDYYDEAEFLKEEEDYFNNQLNWFNEFDNFLFSIYPEAKDKNLKLATNYYFYIKNMVDSLIIRSKVIDIFINKIKPKSIVYVSTRWKEDLINSIEFSLLPRRGQSLFSRLIPLFCEKYDINFQRIILKKELDLNDIDLGNNYFLNRIKKGLKSNIHVRNLWYLYKTFCINNIFLKLPNKDIKCNFLFLKMTGYNIIDICKEAQKRGHGVFYKQGNKITKNILYPKVVKNICPNIISISKQDATNYLKRIHKYKIISWINDYCNIDITNIIMPRLRYFINEWCPQIISLIDKYVRFYDDNHIDLVVTTHMVSVDEFAAIIATKCSIKTKSACLQHGDSVAAYKAWDFIEFSPYHIYFATNNEMEKYIKDRIQLRNLNTKVFQYSNRFKILPKINNLKNRVRSKIGRKIVVFVPTMYSWDASGGGIMPDAWYFKWHKKLINYFSSRKDFNFIWKGIPGSNHMYDPIPNLINDRKYKNIRYATEPFIKWIKRADLVLLDLPSTALYEAAISGLPVMSLSFYPLNYIRGSALKLFGNSLELINSFDEGIAKIDNFLNSNPDEFIVSIPYSKTPIMDTIKSFKENIEK